MSTVMLVKGINLCRYRATANRFRVVKIMHCNDFQFQYLVEKYKALYGNAKHIDFTETLMEIEWELDGGKYITLLYNQRVGTLKIYTQWD